MLTPLAAPVCGVTITGYRWQISQALLTHQWIPIMKHHRYIFTLCLTLLLGMLCSHAASADTIPAANTAYSGIRQVVTAEGSFTQTVHHSHGKERNEMQMEGMSMIAIIRPDKKLAWQLMPMQKMYMQVDLATANKMSGKAPDDVTIEKVGSDTLDGISTTKYKILMKDKSAGGFIWLTAENIPLKMDFISKEGKAKNRITMTLTNLKVEPQDAALFELPAGYHPMPSMGNMLKNLTSQ
jgi:outer membrane lipoprotein-sorting protein